MKNSVVYFFLVITLFALSSCLFKKRAVVAASDTYYNVQNETKSKTFFDVQSQYGPISYLYAPGLLGTEFIMGRYCPEFTAVTGEKITCNIAGHVIGQPHTAVVFPEISLRKPGRFTLNIIKAITDSIKQDLAPLFLRLLQDTYDFKITDNPASKRSVVHFGYSLSDGNIAQKKDIRACHKAYKSHIKKYPNTQLVLYGDSRGAATIFNFIALHKPKQVKAAVLEGIFDDIPHVIKHFLYHDKEPRAEKRMHRLVSFLMGSYKRKGPFPIDYVQKMDDTIPLLLVTSLKDGLTAPQGAIKLYLALCQKGLKKIHLLVLNDALHPCYMVSNKEDRERYETTVHAFYKQYGLSYNAQKAQQGQVSFASTQPSKDDLMRYRLPTCLGCVI